MENKSEYAEKFKDPRWQKKRLDILQRDEFMCQQCFDDKSTLHVHHLFYLKGKDPWDYPDNAFLTLCELCHEIESSSERYEMDKLLVTTLRGKGFLNGHLLSFSSGFHSMETEMSRDITVEAVSWLIGQKGFAKFAVDEFFKHIGKGWKERLLGTVKNGKSSN